MSESFDLRDIEIGLRKSMLQHNVEKTISDIRTARAVRRIEVNSAETTRLMNECEHMTGEEWMKHQNRITELFAEHRKLCEVFEKET